MSKKHSRQALEEELRQLLSQRRSGQELEAELKRYYACESDELLRIVKISRAAVRALAAMDRAIEICELHHRARDHLRHIAPKGGRATSHYTDAEVIQAFTVYKHRHPDKSAWDAANVLIRDGQPLAKYRRVTGPWNRIGRIAENQFGITREEWYADL